MLPLRVVDEVRGKLACIDAVAQVATHDGDFANAGRGEGPQLPVQDRPAVCAHHAFGDLGGVLAQAAAAPGRDDDGLGIHERPSFSATPSSERAA